MPIPREQRLREFRPLEASIGPLSRDRRVLAAILLTTRAKSGPARPHGAAVAESAHA